MSILEELKKKLSDIEIQNLAMEGCSPTFTVSDIMDLIDSVESDKKTAKSAQNVLNDDLISRKAAIDVANRVDYDGLAVEDVAKVTDAVVEELKALPSVQTDLTHIVFETLAECGIYGEEATVKFIGTLKRIGRSDLLPPCAR